MELDILHEDASVLLLNKPCGVLTQAPPGIDNMELRVRRYLASKSDGNPDPYVGIVHRLDRPASGVLCFGKSKKMTRRLSEQFQGRLVQKKYWAIVSGEVTPVQDTWTDWMRKVPGEARSELSSKDLPDSKKAILSYRVVQQLARCSWLEIELHTGRTHQIRLQTSSREHPIFGDTAYGSTAQFGPNVTDARDSHIALHAQSLEVEHPKTKDRLKVTAPMPDTWMSVAKPMP